MFEVGEKQAAVLHISRGKLFTVLKSHFYTYSDGIKSNYLPEYALVCIILDNKCCYCNPLFLR